MIVILWLFNPRSDAVALMLMPIAYFWGYLLIRDPEHKRLGVYWLVWTVVITYGLSIDVAVLQKQWLLGFAGFAASVGETWLTWRLLHARPPNQRV